MTALAAVALAALAAACLLGDLRCLRVAQREHYLAPACSVFAWRWWSSSSLNGAIVLAALGGVVASAFLAGLGLVTAAAVSLGPLGLSLKGRTSRLVVTRRLLRAGAGLACVETCAVAAAGAAFGLGTAVIAAAAVAVLVPALADLVLWCARPLEHRLSERFVREAAVRLTRVAPVVVAVTGSYGKTTTKGYIAHLLGGSRTLVASPQSFNNRLGLARTVNEQLGPSTEVLVAEMGAYGPGEIAEMCSWLTPHIAVITAVGPAHLERFKTLEATLEAKAEITSKAPVVVLNGDDERLAMLGERLEHEGKRVLTASGVSPKADVAVLRSKEGIEIWLGGCSAGTAIVGDAGGPSSLSNVACALAVAFELGVGRDEALTRLPGLPVVSNRLQRYEAAGGYVVLDDTFNSNPAGTRIALARLAAEAPNGRRVLVTPGMVELGPVQRAENAQFAEAAARVAGDIIVVGRTNRRALVEGARRVPGGARVRLARRLEAAVALVRSELRAGDAVLYENDLPDHYP